MSLPRSLASFVLTSLVAAQAMAAEPALAGYGADPQQTSVSGLSSGAFMAVQMQVAYSGSIVGAGVVAGGPYYCAASSMGLFIPTCTGHGLPIPLDSLVTAARLFDNKGQIDPLSNLSKRRIYAFNGTRDIVVHQPAVDATVSFFKEVGVRPEQLKYVKTVPSGHALITPSYGNDCAANDAPYISHCSIDNEGYDQAQAILEHIYGLLNPRVETPAGKVVRFNQNAYASDAARMADTGYLYVPPSCTTAGSNCKVHVALHGCEQSAESVYDLFYTHTGYNNWADNNKLLVLYPQVNKSPPTSPFGWNNNFQGCWDWWGYTGNNYAYKSGAQMKAINAMVKQLTQPPAQSPM